ncbi:MAG TPA: hypothetical protein VGH99_12930 [Pseudonocardia sp.]|jgi:hypothetical protein
MTADHSSDPGRQRTVAELLQQYGDTRPGAGRRRRKPDGDDDAFDPVPSPADPRQEDRPVADPAWPDADSARRAEPEPPASPEPGADAGWGSSGWSWGDTEGDAADWDGGDWGGQDGRSRGTNGSAAPINGSAARSGTDTGGFGGPSAPGGLGAPGGGPPGSGVPGTGGTYRAGIYRSDPRGYPEPGYPDPQAYQPDAGGHPEQQGYPDQQGYPTDAGGYPPEAQAYPPDTKAYPPDARGHPADAGGYQPDAQAYPPDARGHPADAGGYQPDPQASPYAPPATPPATPATGPGGLPRRVPEHPTEQLPRYPDRLGGADRRQLTGPITNPITGTGRVSPDSPWAEDPAAGVPVAGGLVDHAGAPVDEDDDAGEASAWARPYAGGERDAVAGTGAGAVAPTAAAAPVPNDVPAGLGPEDAEPDVEPSALRMWAMLIVQGILGAIGGAVAWVGFRYLWLNLPVVALGAAVLATLGLVLLVRAIRGSDDPQTTILAVLVGLVVTISPAVLLLTVR